MPGIVQSFGVWAYVILFPVIFCETRLVVTPILPGDSRFFALGTLAAQGALSIEILLVLLCIAAIAGDTINYSIGHFIGAIPAVKNNFTLVIMAIIIVSVMPGVVGYWHQRRKSFFIKI